MQSHGMRHGMQSQGNMVCSLSRDMVCGLSKKEKVVSQKNPPFFDVIQQCVAVCCSVLQCVAVCCSVLQCVAVCCSVLQCVVVCYSVLQCVAFQCVYTYDVTHSDTLHTGPVKMADFF